MLPFALLLMAGGLVAAVYLALFICENLLSLLLGAFAARIAMLIGWGWPRAVASGLVTFAASSVTIRLTWVFARSGSIRLILAAVVITPAALASFALIQAVLAPIEHGEGWCTGVALVGAVTIAGRTLARFTASPSP